MRSRWLALTPAWSQRIWKMRRSAPTRRQNSLSLQPETLEVRTLPATYTFPVIADGIVFDRNLDGIFEGVNTTNTIISTLLTQPGGNGDERGVFEFDLNVIPTSEIVFSVVLRVNLSTVAVPLALDYVTFNFQGATGDGVVSAADLQNAVTPLRSFSVPRYYSVPREFEDGLYDIALDPGFFQSRIETGAFVSIVSQALTTGANLSVRSQDNTAVAANLRPQLIITTIVPTTGTVSVSPATVSESGGPNAASLTITRTGGDPSLPVNVELTSTDPSEATVQSTVTIPANTASVQVNVSAVDDTLLDGPQPVRFVASFPSAELSGPGLPVADPEFGGENGILIPGALPDYGSLQTAHPRIVVQPDGKTISLVSVTGPAGLPEKRDWQLVRLNSDGSFDTSFGVNGVVTTSLPNIQEAETAGLTLQSDGKIVVVGSSALQGAASGGWMLVRYNTNGSFDTGFGASGVVHETSTIKNLENGAQEVVQLPDGKLLVGGIRTLTTGGLSDYSVSRYLPNGTRDTTFGIGGIATYHAANPASLYPSDVVGGMAVQSDGKIVLVGSGYAINEIGIVRFNANGTLDTSFNGDGLASFAVYPPGPAPGRATGNSVVIQPDGGIVVAARIIAGGLFSANLAVLRLTTAGNLDTTFSSDGYDVVTLKIEQFDPQRFELTLLPDGGILAAGSSYPFGTYDPPTLPNHDPTLIPSLFRYSSDGTRDMSYGPDGIFRLTAENGFVTYTSDPPPSPNIAQSSRGAGFYSLAWQPDGRLVALAASPSGAYVVRFGADGEQAISNTLQVTDRETLSMTISRASINEGVGPNAAFGTVTRNNTDIGQPLVVSLSSNDLTEATVPIFVTIPANTSTVSFQIDAVDDLIFDNDQTVTFTATASGYVLATDSIVVTDNDFNGAITPGNILVTRPGTAANSYEIAEFTPSGTFVHAITVPWGTAGGRPAGQGLRDLIQDQLGKVYLYNGTTTPFLTSYDPTAQTFASQTFAGWSSDTTNGSGGVATFHQFVFVSDSNSAADGAPAGIVRFERTNNSVLRVDNATGYQDLTVGLDRLLYVLNQNHHVDVYDPVTLSLLRSINLPTGDYRGLAITTDGRILAAGADGNISLFDSNGSLLNSVNSGAAFLTDIDVDPSGQVIAGSLAGDLIITNLNLTAPTKITASTAQAFVAFAIDAAFPAPTLHTTPTPLSLVESDSSSSVDTGILVTDDGTDLVGATVRFSASYFQGLDELAFTNQNGIQGEFDPETGTLKLSGAASVADYQAALRTVQYLTNSNNPQVSRTVTLTVTDGVSSATATRIILLTASNDAPIVNSNQIFFVPENSPNNTAMGTVAAIDPDSPVLSAWTIVSGNETNLFAINPTTGAIRVVNGGQLDFENIRSYTIGLTVSDGTLTSAVQTVTIRVTDQNDNPPIIRPDQAFTIAENSVNGSKLGAVIADDIDTVGTLQSWTIVSGNEAGTWAINPDTGELSVAVSSLVNYEVKQTYILGVQVSDGVQTSAIQTIQINVTDRDDIAPVITPGLSFFVPENSENNTPAGTVTATDADTLGALKSYTIVSGNNSGVWMIDSIAGVITVKNSALLDFETTPNYTLGITVSDGTQISLVQTVAIHLTNVNESPSLPPAVFSIPETSTGGLIVGSVQGIDPDAGQTLTYTITAGSTGNNFTLNPTTGVITVANGATFDFETTPSYSFIVTVTDSGSPTLVGSGMVTISLTNGEDPPTITPGQGFFIAENSPNGTLVGTVDARDPDAGQSITFSIIGGNSSGAFAINSANGQITVADSSKLNFETTKSFTVTIQVTDNGVPALSVSAPVTVFVTNVNETPVIVPATFTLTENSPKNTLVGNVTGLDPDVGQLLLYTIESGNAGNAFSLHITQGTITVNNVAAVDFETNPVFTLNVKVQDNGSPNLFSTTVITINLTNVIDPPSFIDQQFTINEGVVSGTTVGTVIASDPDQNLPLTYEIIEGDIDGKFVLDPQTGVLKVAASFKLDYETEPFIPLLIQVTKPGSPPLTTTATVMVNLNDVNEPSVFEDASFNIDENSVGTTPVGTVSATDPDQGQSVSYSISAGNTNNAFQIDPTTGAIHVADIGLLNYESVPDYILSIQATDSGFPPRTTTAQVTIHVHDLNEIPVINNQLLTIPEDTANGSVLLTLSATNPEQTQQLTYSIIAGNSNNAFAINSETGQITVINNGVLNFEAPTQLVLTIQVVDNGQPSLSDTATLTLQVTDVNEPPHLTPTTFTLAENSPVGTVVGTILAVDEDGNQHTTYAVTASDLDGLFAISPNGLLTIAKPDLLDFETHPVIHLTVTTSDDGTPAASESKQFTVQLTNVDEPPEIVLSPGVRTLSIPVKPQAFDPQARIRDVDTPTVNVANSTLQVKVIDNASSSDRVRLLKSRSGDLVIKGRNVLYQGTLIGTRTFGKKGGVPLTVNFNGAATQAGVESVLKKIYYRTKGASGSTRTLEFSLSGLDGGKTSKATRVVKLD